MRQILQNHPENIRILLNKLVRLLESQATAPNPSQFLHVVRVLTRLVPYVFEWESQHAEDTFFWAQTEEGALAPRLVHTIFTALFLPGFAVEEAQPAAENQGQPGAPREELLWTKGIGSKIKGSNDARSKMNANRSVVLRLLLVCLSGPLYYSSKEYKSTEKRWTKLVCLGDEKAVPNRVEFFYSALNMLHGYDPVGWGIPYGSVFTSGTHETCVQLCVQALLVLLDFQDDENHFARLLAQLSRDEDFSLLYDTIHALLQSVHEARNTYLPLSLKGIPFYQEMLVLLWKLLNGNEAFFDYVLKNKDITGVVIPLVFFIWRGRKDIAYVGLVHICTFILLLLSGERSFGIALNRPFTAKLSLDGCPPLKHSNHADLLVLVFHKVLVDGCKQLEKLYSCAATILCNISPYCKSLSLIASVKLVNLFILFAKPKYLLAAPDNYVNTNFILDAFNNIIQYQYEGNPHLIYAMCCNEHAFRKLAKPEKTEDTPEGEVNDSTGGSKAAERTNPELRSVLDKLKLSTVLRLLDHLVPHLEQLCQDRPLASLSDKAVVAFLRDTTLVGLLPVPHAIVIRKYQPNEFTTLWFTTYLWGVLFTQNKEVPLWDSSTIRLFRVTMG